jgi:hypothetical protein
MIDEWLFDRVLVTDYYDGATGGLVGIRGKLGIWRFDVVAWDSDRIQRVFAFAQITGQETCWEDIERLLSPIKPDWPNWYPMLQTEDGKSSEAAEAIYQMLEQAGQYQLTCVSTDIEEVAGGLREIPQALHGPLAKFRRSGALLDFGLCIAEMDESDR